MPDQDSTGQITSDARETGDPADVAAMPRVSVVVVSWNALAIVQKCLPSVVASSYPNLEILFADNGSDDGTSEWVSRHHPQVTLIRHPENWAFCKGNNAAARHATGKYLLLLNNDVQVPPDWLDPLVRTFEADPEIGALQPKILDFSDRSRFEYAGAAGGFIDRNGYPFARGRLFFDVEPDTGQYDTQLDVFWATGAALMTRRSVFEQLGGLDERLVMHMEEIDYCWRVQRRGLRVVCQPQSSVYHIGGASLLRGSTRKIYLNYRNNLLVLYKNLPSGAWTRIFIRRMLLDGLGMIRALLLLRPAETWAILRGYAAAHRMRGLFAPDRPSNESADVMPTYRGNIVWDYFFRSRRRFSDLPTRKFIAGISGPRVQD